MSVSLFVAMICGTSVFEQDRYEVRLYKPTTEFESLKGACSHSSTHEPGVVPL